MDIKGHMMGFISNSEYFFDEVKPKNLDFKVTIFNEHDLSVYVFGLRITVDSIYYVS